MIPVLSDLILTPPDDSLLYAGHYDALLVVLSVGIAILAAHVALLITRKVAGETATGARAAWIAAGGLCMGAGIWAMHFVGMLAFSLPCVTSYDPWITLASMVPGVLASVLAVTIISRPVLGTARLALGGLLLGGGIGAMHFSGMAAMRLEGFIRYDARLFAASIVAAVALAVLALWTKFRLQARWPRAATPAGAVVLGLAVSGMHYTAMSAAYFVRDSGAPAVDFSISPAFLASVVLVATSAVIVAALAAIILSRPSITPTARHYRLTAALVGLWVGLAWMISGYYGEQAEARVLAQASLIGERQAADVVETIQHDIQILEGIASLLAQDQAVVKALRRFGPAAVPSSLPAPENRKRWSTDRVLGDLGRHMGLAATNFTADVVYLMNAAGDCVASSNAETPSSFVGSNFQDRAYFQIPREGKPGRQYAFGRVSRIPGLYFSHPVQDQGRFLGAVVVKRDIPRFRHWADATEAFIVDANGVVLSAADPAFEFHTMPGARPVPEAMIAQFYGRPSLEAAAITAWEGGRLPGIVRLGQRPIPKRQTELALPGQTITIHVFPPVPDLPRITAERRWLFALLVVAGALVIAASVAAFAFLEAVRRAKADLERESARLFKVNDELERFAYVLAHHIQEPVRLQHIFSQRLERTMGEELPAGAKASLTQIVTNASRLRALIRDVQKYLAVQSDTAACDANLALATASKELGHMLAAAGGEIEAGSLPLVPLSPVAMLDVFRALIENAIQYRHPDRRLRIVIGTVEANEETVIFVRDNGAGIPANLRDNVFAIFERLHTDESLNGTGVGLALVRKVVESADGRVWIDDGDDGGICVNMAFAGRNRR